MQMIDYVRTTPDQLRANLARADELVRPLVTAWQEAEVNSLVLVASGSSYNAAMIALPQMRALLRQPMTVITPEQYCLAGTEYAVKPFVVTISQSGASTNIVRALDQMATHGERRILLTSQPASVAAGHAELVVDYGLGTETVEFVTLGLSALVWFLVLAAAKCADALTSDFRRDLTQVPTAYAQVLRVADQFFDTHVRSLAEMREVFVCGNDMNLGVAREGALKMQETIKVPARHYEIEEFLHGPAYQLTAASTVWLIDDPTPSARIGQIHAALAKVTTRGYLITTRPDAGAQALIGTPLRLPLMSGLVNVAVSQLLCARLMHRLEREAVDPLARAFQSAVQIKQY
ncbi:SIS domain-containing protein [Lacticaseibacillus absianus]|uniref:SIS domain-containing protein n=1 Tax=Lacticaseibacillus absianus TaxID=2729623 RepID=UPI0015C6A117|nr:SIS domain-containing protein [Lacticaseibacillus absianus]